MGMSMERKAYLIYPNFLYQKSLKYTPTKVLKSYIICTKCLLNII